MTLTVSSTAATSATPQEVLEFVLDFDRYRQADHKITRVSSSVGPDENGAGSVRLWGRLPGMPPAPDRQNFTLERWSRLRLVGAPRQPGRLVFEFTGTFDCVLLDDGSTEVTHAYEFKFRRGFRWLERRMAKPLADEIDQEVKRLAGILGKPEVTPSSSNP